MTVMFLQAANRDLDRVDEALERPSAPPDYKVAAGAVLEAIEAAVEEFTLEMSTASEWPRFEALADFTRRARAMALDLSERQGGSRDKGMEYARSSQRLFSAIQNHSRLLQHVRALELAKVSCSADIIALGSTFTEIESALDNLLGTAKRLLAPRT